MNLSFLKDRSFLKEMLVIAVPISFQQLINASLNMIDVIMVGQLGETSIAALGLSNQVLGVFMCLVLVRYLPELSRFRFDILWCLCWAAGPDCYT